MTKIPEPLRTVGQVLPTINAPLWRRDQSTHRMRDEFWRGFWWAVGASGALGAWGGWLAAQIYPICSP